MAKCGFCNATSITRTSSSQGGQQVILITCGSCQAVLGAVPRK